MAEAPGPDPGTLARAKELVGEDDAPALLALAVYAAAVG